MKQAVTLDEAFAGLRFCATRTAASGEDELAAAFAEISAYRDGGIFIGHYAGSSAWERHRQGDEIVYVLEGATTLILLDGGAETRLDMNSGQMIVVPQGTWHRFETPDGVKILTVTPQPTDHSVELPRD